MFLQANLPPIELYVKKEYLYDFEKGHGELVEGLWVTVKSIQGRALYFETYLPEYGAVYDKLPLSAFVWKKDFEGEFVFSFRFLMSRTGSKWYLETETSYFRQQFGD